MKALVVEIPPQVVKYIQLALKQIDEKASILAATADSFVKTISFQTYDLVFLPENLHLKLTPALTKIPMEIRRQMILILLIEKGKSLDPLQAFVKHVDAVISLEDLSALGQHLLSVLDHHRRLYKGFQQIKQTLEMA